MSDAIEVLKKDIISYEEIRKSGKKCLTTNNEECCFVHYPEIKEALLALDSVESLKARVTSLSEQKEKVKKWLNKNIKKKENLLEQLIESKDDCLNDLIEQEKEEDEILSVQEYWNKKIGEMTCEKIVLEEVLNKLEEGVEK